MPKTWDVVATLKFTKRDGTDGKSYVRCGTAREGDKGISLKLDSVPVSPSWDGWLNFYDPKPKDGDAKETRVVEAPDADIPF